MPAAHQQRVTAPSNQRHDHNGRELHDPQGLLARLADALDVFPPEVNSHHDRKHRSDQIGIQREVQMRVGKQLVQQPGQILSRSYSADGARKNVVEHERRHGKFRQRPAHCFLHDTVDASPHVHAAALDVQLKNGVRKQHRREDEPRGGLPDELFRLTARVIGRGSDIVQYDRRRSPVRNEREHGRRGHKDLGYGAA